ncbi:phosphate acyltransferase PlsX [Fictibacillus barbaricus]|uniref:Phosphate acyltransferase n=1 Tax=Fictibacillus barbaricus TaxID=182136 RepID=A0ABS2ZCF6_9BACL|nr:phosphate acyltransferase PlsX [Fictibacillus barbaricus]MBN3545883.1 phosphate acyltransferase PlsX [Fictibacillus barbaricus]GGB56868.1 phosphate acyltransferase [Fictibacillus barbaricus]
MNIAIDAMGGDNAPQEIVKGALLAVEQYPELAITLVGDEEKIKQHLPADHKFSIIHTDEVIETSEEPVRAVRRKKNSSMVLAANEVKSGKADAYISAGNTGALMASGLFYVGRIKGIERPALAPTLPTLDGKGFLFLDVGANMDAKPEHLLQYALMGSIYCQQVRGIEKPRVGLLNVGTESEKGNTLTKAAFPLLEDADINFVGNVESRDLLMGAADVVVCDGFAGNLVLKSIEGTAISMFSMIKEQLTSSFTSKLAAGVLKPKLRGIKDKLDYTEYGGAGLFGLAAPVIKAHGSSNANAVLNAIRQTVNMVEKNVVPTIQSHIKSDDQKEE